MLKRKFREIVLSWTLETCPIPESCGAQGTSVRSHTEIQYPDWRPYGDDKKPVRWACTIDFRSKHRRRVCKDPYWLDDMGSAPGRIAEALAIILGFGLETYTFAVMETSGGFYEEGRCPTVNQEDGGCGNRHILRTWTWRGKSTPSRIRIVRAFDSFAEQNAFEGRSDAEREYYAKQKADWAPYYAAKDRILKAVAQDVAEQQRHRAASATTTVPPLAAESKCETEIKTETPSPA